MITNNMLRNIGHAAIFLTIASSSQAATTDLASVPLVTSSTSSVLPNIIFVLDDSGSMGWNFLPDWANSSNQALIRNAGYNGVAYNPSITYTPPTSYNSDGTLNTTRYPSMTGTSAATGGGTVGSTATPRWTNVPIDAYGVQSTSNSNLEGNAYFYTFAPGEYCAEPSLRTCTAASAPSTSYPYPATLRWCTSSALTTCQAVRIETGTTTYLNARYPSPRTATISVSGSSSTSITSIKVNGLEILSAATTASTTSSTVASSIRTNINSCTTGLTGACQAVGYSATLSGSTVTISAPGAISYTPVVTKSGTMTVTATAFGAGSIPGVNQRTDIVSAINSYPYPGSITKASARTDCVGTTCTYTEEMTNYANWWAYYHTRMQMMKTSASIAFAPVDINYRVGYLSINNNTSSDFLNIGKFDGTQKNTWYTKITSAIPGSSTPLRTALTKAGRLYAGKLNGTTLNGSTVADPIQYSCQQNFTILSTDGYWNEANPGGYQLDGTTAIGNQDSAEPRPMLDGNGTSNTLADVSEYYYANDLRTTALGNCTGSVVPPATTGNTLCSSASPDPYNNVPTSGLDGASWQHMTTFTLGLGASGYMQYSPNYVTASSGDFFDVKNGTAANTGICSWQASGICNWPIPVSNTQTTIDDLWHTAVNGRGTYFSATNPASLSSGLSSALAGVSARTGSSAAATTSNPNVTSGDNFVFSSTFTTQEWDGELVRQQLDLTTGITSSTIDWAAQSSLDTKVAGTGYTTRTIYTFDSTTVSKLKPFTWTDLTSTEQAYFSSPYVTLSQFCTTGVTCLSATNQANAVGANLVNFLRGDRSNEGTPTDTSKYYHLRLHVLGDIVNAEAVYVKASLFNFADRGYSDFKTANATRQGMVYAAANDGMLHAFYAASNSTTGVVGGNEAWAYIPSIILPKLNKLADKNYSSLHQYFVDGTPIVGEICVSDCATTISSAPAAVWKTILVGGLNGGGRGYYALDITNPASPKALWEFTDTNMGFTYGNPKIGKLKDGTWAVFVTSGYNNVSPGDGQGRLYVLNANTGALIRSIATGVGKPAGSTSSVVAADGTTVCTATTAAPAACPSGLARIAAPVISTSSDNTVRMIYGGDLYGNLWRFDVNGDLGASGYDAQLLATFRGPSPASNVQPITAKPQVGDVSGNLVIYVGTGSYLGTADLTDTSMQSIYALKDTLPATSTPSTAIYGVPRTFGGFVQQTQTNTVCPAGSPPSICITGQLVRTSSSNVVNFASDNGWFLDLPDSGERANTDPTLGLGTLGFTTNVPNSSACTVGGYSYRYFLDYRTGAAVSTSTTKVVAAKLGNALATRPVYVRLPNNTIVELTRLSDGTTVTSNVPIGNAAGATRRVSWRELISE